MHRRILQICGPRLRPLNARATSLRSWLPYRSIATTSDYDLKYAEQLRQRAQEKGLTVDELKLKAKEKQAEEARRKREAVASQPKPPPDTVGLDAKSTQKPASAPPPVNVRKDSSPIRPLSSILNLSRIMSTPHTADQISALWTTYHASRSDFTGRGYVCASVPLPLYQKMASIAERYSSFVVPVPRVRSPEEPTPEGEESTAYEFYFLQWHFHDIPPRPTATEDPFTPPTPGALSSGANPPTSTILFTPLQEYKLRASFATPYLVMTHYTDLVDSHGVVLLRGEITPGSASAGGGVDGRYMLSQADAQLLSMAVQKFYLWGGTNEKEGERLLRCFHETPEDFKWEDLLKHAKWTI